MKKMEDNNKDKKRIALYIVIIVILILLLITSCTSNLFGKLGSLFKNEGTYTIEEGTNDNEEILNQDLTFDGDEFTMSLSDNNLKISFSYRNIYPTSFTCTTSDANVATCYVKDGYVIVNPKGVGETIIYLQTNANGKIYKASTKVIVTEEVRTIKLSSKSGTIYLESNNTKYVSFSLVNLSGKVTATSSNNNIAVASIENNVLKLVAYKKGNVTITLTLNYNDKVYTATYYLTVLEGKNPNAEGNSSGNTSGDSSKPSSGTTTPSNPNNPSNPGDGTTTPNDYELFTKESNYIIGIRADQNGKLIGTKTIILYSQNRAMFNGEVESSYQDNVLTIWDKENPSTKIVVTLDDPNGVITNIKYNSNNEVGPTSLPIEITAENEGIATLSVMGYVNGVPVHDGFTINLTITKKFIVNLYSNDGYFDLLNKVDKYNFELELNDTLDLSKYIPFKTEDNCHYYKFLGYSELNNANATIYTNEFTINENTNVITDLYAVFSVDEYEDENPEFKTMWIFDPELFINEEARKIYGEDKKTLVYPGASGKYTMNIENNAGQDIKIVGMTLAENTVCVDEGCLNMGYIIKYPTTDYYYLGNDTNATCGVDNKQYCDNNYYVLNNESNNTRNTKEISFENHEIVIPNGSGISLYLDWKWVEKNHILDTKIGKKANLSDEEEIYDLYHFSLAIHYKNVSNECKRG